MIHVGVASSEEAAIYLLRPTSYLDLRALVLVRIPFSTFCDETECRQDFLLDHDITFFALLRDQPKVRKGRKDEQGSQGILAKMIKPGFSGVTT
jgi:translation initiation factor RLI1